MSVFNNRVVIIGYCSVVHTDSFTTVNGGDVHYSECTCGKIIDSEAHSYDNACDTTCGVCDNVREVGDHVYDNACDTTCNICGAKRATEAHVFGETETVTAATSSADGEGRITCTVCGASETVVIPEVEGLSRGAVAAITAGGTVAAGIGGFSLLWFVIRKKKWIDLIAAFK